MRAFCDRLKSRDGSCIVFLTILLPTLLIISLALMFTARQKAVSSSVDGVLNLAGDSVLSYYDYNIREDYGLFLLRGDSKFLNSRFREYATYSLNSKNGIRAKSIQVNGSRFSTIAILPVENQIIAYMKAMKVAGGSDASQTLEGQNTSPFRTLRHKATILSLPSRSLPDGNIVTTAENFISNLKNPSAIFKEGTSKYMLDSYILSKFNREDVPAEKDHFFRNEVEYVIGGQTSDSANLKICDTALIAIRTGLNLSHIYSDTKKMEIITLAAETITPGILGTVTTAGIASIWAGGEAINDIKLLHSGYPVPLIKDEGSWALDLETIIEGYDKDKKLILPKETKGRYYGEYLRVLLFMKNDNIKTARILDLIQINMRKNHDGSFLISECSTGISISAEVNRGKFYYDKTY